MYTTSNEHSLYSLLHPTREYTRKRLHKIDAEQIQQRHFIAYYWQLAQENGGNANTEDREKRATLEASWRHAVSAADVAAELGDAESSGNIADWLIHFVHRQALWAEGTFLYARSLQARQKTLPASHPYIATSLNNLAFLYRSQGRYAEAEPLYTQALDIFVVSLGARHPSTLTVLGNFLRFLINQERMEDAGAFLAAKPELQETYALLLARQSG